MSKYILEIDTDSSSIAAVLQGVCKMWNGIPGVQSVQLWEDDGSIFVSKGDILYP